jgi:hypothetical protein
MEGMDVAGGAIEDEDIAAHGGDEDIEAVVAEEVAGDGGEGRVGAERLSPEYFAIPLEIDSGDGAVVGDLDDFELSIEIEVNGEGVRRVFKADAPVPQFSGLGLVLGRRAADQQHQKQARCLPAPRPAAQRCAKL